MVMGLTVKQHAAAIADRRKEVGRAHDMRFGAVLHKAGVEFRLWAPNVDRVCILLRESSTPVKLSPMNDGWYSQFIDGVGPVAFTATSCLVANTCRTRFLDSSPTMFMGRAR
jgi:hypothetical protein